MSWWEKQREEDIIMVRFIPAEDIHVNELAYIVAHLSYLNGAVKFKQSQWDALTPNVKRHFQ